MQTSWKTRIDIEKLVYKNGINVALYNAERSKTYKNFVKGATTALYNPIKEIASDERNIENLLLFTKGIDPAFLTQIGVFVAANNFGRVNLAAFLYWAGDQGGQAALDKLEIAGTFVLKNKELIEFFDDHSQLIINSVDEYTKKWIAGKIQYGKDNLLPPKEIAQLLIDEGKGISKVRAERIAITELAAAMSKVEVEAARKYGIKEIIWRTSKDDRVDPICLDLEGEKVQIGQLFPDGYSYPPAHPSCRCFIEEVIPSEWEPPKNPWLGE